MNTIKRILLVIDGQNETDSLLSEIISISTAMQTHVTLLGIHETSVHPEQMDEQQRRIYQWINEDRQEQLESIASTLEKSGIEVSSHHLSGKPWLEIIHHANQGHYDLIMKPADNESGFKHMLFGSTDMQLFRMSPLPVWIFKPTPNRNLKNIALAVDLLPYDDERNSLADKILLWGKQVADIAGSHIHVVHTWKLFGELTLRGRSISSNTVDKLVHDEEKKQHQLLSEAIQRNGLETDRVTVHFCQGEAKKLIPEIVNTENIDLLVMGTVSRTGIPGFFIGNTAETVLHQVDCSVLAVKPDNFSSPV